MPGKMSKEEVDAFLDSKPGWMMLTSQGSDGYPHSVPIGYFRDGDRIFMGCRDNTQKIKNIELDILYLLSIVPTTHENSITVSKVTDWDGVRVSITTLACKHHPTWFAIKKSINFLFRHFSRHLGSPFI